MPRINTIRSYLNRQVVHFRAGHQGAMKATAVREALTPQPPHPPKGCPGTRRLGAGEGELTQLNDA